MFNLKGKVAFGTGAGGEYGSGLGFALRLTEDGADVVATRPRDEALCRRGRRACRRQLRRSGAVPCPAT